MKAQLDQIRRAYEAVATFGDDELERASVTIALTRRILIEIADAARATGGAEAAAMSDLLAEALDTAHTDIATRRAEDRQMAALKTLALRPVEGRA